MGLAVHVCQPRGKRISRARLAPATHVHHHPHSCVPTTPALQDTKSEDSQGTAESQSHRNNTTEYGLALTSLTHTQTAAT